MEKLKVFSGRANKPLAEEIANYLEINLSEMEVSDFADGETHVKIKENVRGADIYIVQPTSPPTNQNLMELLIIIDAMRRSSARRITAVIPYYGYARQDRKTEPRVSIASKLCANLLVSAGAHRILTMDLHAGQIQGFFDIPVDPLIASPIMVDYFKNNGGDNLVIVSPDTGGAERARDVAKRLDASLAIIDKRRPEKNQTEVMHVIGDVTGKKAIIFDDIIDTGGTVLKAASALKREGASSVSVFCTHPVLSGEAIERLEESEDASMLITTNTIPIKKESKKITVLSVANLFGEAIKRINEETSISSLFQ
ncbi:ribose-phosphate pyrophosphokinase [bacterium]|nr:ribose-phosphate pyrophosphokinase [bacterium]